MSTRNKSETQNFIAEICDGYGDGNFIFRGTTKIFKTKYDRVCSSLYIWAKSEKIINKHHKPPKIEKEIVEKAKIHFPDRSSNIEILTDIRHYGGKVNLIDFTRNLYIALFFACNGDFNKDGEIIVLETSKLSQMADIKYDNLKDGDVGMIEPAKTQASQLRVVAQDSIFVYSVEGYIEKSRFKPINIPKELKDSILDFIKKFSNINQDTVYNDLIGFITNEANYDTAASLFYQGNAKSDSGEYKEAIKDYNKAIELNPKSAIAYNNRGNAKSDSGEYEDAIKDYDKAIELDPQLAEAYYNRGLSKDYLEEYEDAIKDYDKAIELNPKSAIAYNNRGNSKYSLEEYEDAIKDYDKAIELDPKYAIAYNNRGNSKYSLEEYEDAIKDYDKAIELDPKYEKAYNNRELSKKKLEDKMRAEADAAKAK